MINEIMLNTKELPTFTNKALNVATKKIATITTKVGKSLYEIAHILNGIETKKLFEEDGFKNTADYAIQTFGYKKSMAYNLIKIGKEYTSPETLESNLPHEEKDFSTSQIVEVLPLKDREKVVELVEQGEITPDMSCREIKKVVKSLTAVEEVEKDEEVEEVGEVEKVKISDKYRIYLKTDGQILDTAFTTVEDVYSSGENVTHTTEHINMDGTMNRIYVETALTVSVFIFEKLD